MKIRLGFVTNSFIMKNGLNRNYSYQELKELSKEKLYELSSGNDEIVPECICPLCCFSGYTNEDMIQYLLKKYWIKKDDLLKEWKHSFGTYAEFKRYIS